MTEVPYCDRQSLQLQTGMYCRIFAFSSGKQSMRKSCLVENLVKLAVTAIMECNGENNMVPQTGMIYHGHLIVL